MKDTHKLAALSAASILILVLVAPPTCLGQGQDLPPQLQARDVFETVCNPDDYGTNPTPPIPPLPQQFSVHVEAAILNRNRTTWIHEFFDEVNNRGRINFFSQGMRERVIYNYGSNEIFLFPDVRNNRDCTVLPLAQSRFINFTFGLTSVNGSYHIGTSRQFFEFLGDDTPINYLGLNNTVRGVPALRWDACINNDNVSMIASYYYNTDDWSYPTIADPSGSNSTLSQMVVRGVSNFNNTVRNFYHVYTVIGFHSGPDSVPDRVFQIPTGMNCFGRTPGKEVPDAPQYFSTYLERYDRSRNSIGVIREFYDSVHDLFRIDFYSDGSFNNRSSGPVQIIQDFDSQVYYYINQHTGNCTASPIANSSFLQDIAVGDDGIPHLASPTVLFYRNYNFTYEGVTTVRGVEVDAYIATAESSVISGGVTLNNVTYELFLTRPEYTLHTDISNGPQQSVPWFYKVSGSATYPNISSPTNMSTTEFDVQGNLFGFSSDEPPYDAFDATLCFDPDDTHLVAMIFETPRLGIDLGVFRTNLRASLVQYLNIRPLQVNNIHIWHDNGTHIFTAFNLVNISEYATPRDSDVSADDAADMLQSAANFSQPLPFTVDLGNNNLVSPIFLGRNRGRNRNITNNNSSSMMCDSTAAPTTANPTTVAPTTANPTTVAPTTAAPTTANPCEDNITTRLKLSDGIVAGIGIGLFFAGFFAALIFILVMVIVCKCVCGKGNKEVSSVKYKKHNDELESY